MSAVDTSRAAVEQLAAHHNEEGKFMEVAIGAGDVDGHRYGAICRKTAATLLAMLAGRAELLEALRKAEQQLDYGQYDAAQDIIRAAIARATGGTP